MAFDEALMRRSARTGEAVFRLYGWSTPTLSLGRNQRARGVYDEEKARAMRIAFVRRPTGGRALLHHREITYSATLPARDAGEARAAYEFINGVLLDALARLGVPARPAAAPVSLPPGPRPCFDLPAEREIEVGARKLVGSAQWRRGGALLQHGSILVQDDQQLIGELMREEAAPGPGAATLAAALGRTPSFDEVALPILESLSMRASQRISPLVLDSALERECCDLRHAYADESWTWRR